MRIPTTFLVRFYQLFLSFGKMFLHKNTGCIIGFYKCAYGNRENVFLFHFCGNYSLQNIFPKQIFNVYRC